MIVAVGLNPALDRILIVPGFSIGETLKCESVQIIHSGKGTNVAVILRLLGAPVRAAGFVGAPEEQLYRERMHGIECDLTVVDGRTRTDTTIIGPVSGTETHIREPGFEVTPELCDRLIDRLLDRIGEGDVVMMSGSLPPGAPDDTYARIVEGCRTQGAHSFLDSSGEALRSGAAAHPTYLKPNEVELAELVGHAVPDVRDTVHAARELMTGGTEAVAVTRGGDGAVLVDSTGAWHGSAAAPEVVNTVGCGDAFASGWIAARCIAGVDGAAQLREALTVGAANAMTHGAGNIEPAHIRAIRAAAHVSAIDL